MPAVANAVVNLAAEKANVEYNSADLSIAEIQDKVKKLGFEAHNIENQRDIDREKVAREAEIRGQRLRLLLSALLSAGEFALPMLPDAIVDLVGRGRFAAAAFALSIAAGIARVVAQPRMRNGKQG